MYVPSDLGEIDVLNFIIVLHFVEGHSTVRMLCVIFVAPSFER